MSVGEAYDAVEFQGRAVSSIASASKVSVVLGGKVTGVFADIGSEVREGDVLAEIFSPELAKLQSDYGKALSSLDSARKKADLVREKVRTGASGRAILEEAENILLNAQKERSLAVSEYEKASSELNQCRARYERAAELYADKIISTQDYETARTEYERDSAALRNSETVKAKAERQEKLARSSFDRVSAIYGKGLYDSSEVAEAESSIGNAAKEKSYSERMIVMSGGSLSSVDGIMKVRAPVSGTVSSRTLSVGQSVAAGDSLFSLSSGRNDFVGNACERDSSLIRKGMTAEVRSEIFPGKAFECTVTGVSSELDPATGTFSVRLTPLSDTGIKAGSRVSISVVTGKRPGAVLVPAESVLDESGRKIVFGRLRHGDEFGKIFVKTGGLCGGNVEILSGLTPSSEVIVKGQGQLKASYGKVELKAGCADGCGGE